MIFDIVVQCVHVESCTGPVYHEDNLISFQKRLPKGVGRFSSTVEQGLQLNCLWTGFLVLRNQVHFLESLPSLSPAAVREIVFLDIPLALTPCGC